MANGGFVIPPEGAYPDKGGGLYTPYLYFYDNDLNLINKVDITSENLHLFVLAGLSDGGFVATGADYGNTTDVKYLLYFNAEGTLINKVDITADLQGDLDYNYRPITGLKDGGVMLTRFGQNKVLIYHSPPQELDLSSAGITSIGSIAGNVFFAQSLPSKVSGKIRDLISGGPINGAIITTSGGGATRSTRGQYSLSEIAGKWTMRAKADGYKPYMTSLSIDPAKQYIRKDINMSRRSKPCW